MIHLQYHSLEPVIYVKLINDFATKESASVNKFVQTVLPNKCMLENGEVEKAKILIVVEIIEYVPHSVVIKTIIKRTTGNISALSFDSGEALTEKSAPFDTFIQIIDGGAEIIIEDKSKLLDTGQAMIIPAHTRNTIKANSRFKMISTVIKSGYEI